MEPLNWAELSENCAGDDSLVREVLELFLAEVDGLVADVKAAVAARDALAVKRSAHRLKGALLSLAADPAAESARILELAGSTEQLGAVAEHYAKLESDVTRLTSFVRVPRAA
jgi:two-component system sensor histidine kinase/response regulator